MFVPGKERFGPVNDWVQLILYELLVQILPFDVPKVLRFRVDFAVKMVLTMDSVATESCLQMNDLPKQRCRTHNKVICS